MKTLLTHMISSITNPIHLKKRIVASFTVLILFALSFGTIHVNANVYKSTEVETIEYIAESAEPTLTSGVSHAIQVCMITADLPKPIMLQERENNMVTSSYVSESSTINTIDSVAEEVTPEEIAPVQEQSKEEEPVFEEVSLVTDKSSIVCNPYDVTQTSNMTFTDIQNLVAGTWLEGREQALYDTEQTYGINIFFIISVSTLESGRGTSKLSQAKQNYYGISVERNFGNYYNSTMYFGDLISRLYTGEGRYSVYEIAPKYCPPNQDYWASFMEKNMKSLYNDFIN